ncbi:MAG: copper homeostasis protein CutC [Paracoccaceae bacterium]
MTGARLEVCVDTIAGFHAAVAGGADRVELCAALDLGGLTPTPGLIAAARGLAIPVRCMIRPRAGDFCFSRAEVDQMKADIDAVNAAGLAGIVLGAATPGGQLDVAVLQELRNHANQLGATLHRVIDTVPDRLTLVETAVTLGFDTVLSSGGAGRAIDACPALGDMVKVANGRLDIMPGSGVGAENGLEILRATGAKWLHSSCSAGVKMPSKLVEKGFCPVSMAQTNTGKTSALADICHGFSVKE